MPALPEAKTNILPLREPIDIINEINRENIDYIYKVMNNLKIYIFLWFKLLLEVIAILKCKTNK